MRQDSDDSRRGNVPTRGRADGQEAWALQVPLLWLPFLRRRSYACHSGRTYIASHVGQIILISTTEGTEASTAFTDADWDFVDETANGTDDIWWILEGQDYPRLWWETNSN